MALKPNKIGSNNPKPRAERIFTDRVEPKEAFAQSLKSISEKDYSVLAFYGVGGIGKTGLKEHFWDIIQKDEVVYSYYDFEKDKNSTPSEIYKKLADRFSINFKVKFTAFSLAYLIYLKKQNPNFEFKKETLPFLEEGDIISNAVEFLSQNAGSAGGLAIKLVGYLYKKYSEIINGDLKQELNELENKEHYEIAQELPRFFAYDLDKFKEKNSSKKVVIFLDTYELLCKKQPNDADTLKQDEWVRNFIEQNQKVLFVISGREKLIWDLDDDWKEVLTQFRLKELNDDDCRYFLNHCGITDEKIQNNIIKCSCGVPFYLDICVEIYESNDGTENFENLKQNEVAERLLRYLDRSERATLELLSVANYFDKEIFKLIIDEFSTGYPATMINELAKFSFISQDNGRYYIQRLMKECLKNQCDTELKSEVHKLLLDYFNAKLSDLSVQTATGYYIEFINEAFYHKENIDGVESAINWFYDNFDIHKQITNDYDENEIFYFINILLQLLLERNYYKNPFGFTRLASDLVLVSDYYSAISCYLKALELWQEFNESEFILEQYFTYINLGNCCIKYKGYRNKYFTNVYIKSNEYNNMALNSYLKALEVATKIGDDEFIANSYNHIGNYYLTLKDDINKAIEYCSNAIDLLTDSNGELKYPDSDICATSYEKLGFFYMNIEEYEKSYEMLNKARNIFEKIGFNNKVDYIDEAIDYLIINHGIETIKIEGLKIDL